MAKPDRFASPFGKMKPENPPRGNSPHMMWLDELCPPSATRGIHYMTLNMMERAEELREKESKAIRQADRQRMETIAQKRNYGVDAW